MLVLAPFQSLPTAHKTLNHLEGKILRLNDDGTIPNDNPFSDSPIFSFGHMNPKGLGWDNEGNLFVTEMGPSKKR